MNIFNRLTGNRTISTGSGKVCFIHRLFQEEEEELEDYTRKVIMFYRNGANDSTSTDVSYKIISGNSVGNEIDLFSADGSSTYCLYGHSFKDFKNRIWYNMVGRTASTYCQTTLYTYPNSCNSWKYNIASPPYPGGWDFWFSPCGKCVGSGHSNRDIQRKEGTLIFTRLSSLNCGPYKGWNSWTDLTYCDNIMPNGELIYSTVVKLGNDGYLKTYYMSSSIGPSGTWYNTLNIQSNFAASGSLHYDRCLCSTKNNVVVFMTSGGWLVGKISTDNARTWGNWTNIEYVGNKYWGYRNFIPVIRSQDYPDDYARFICLKYYGDIVKDLNRGSDSTRDAFKIGYVSTSGQHRIYKINTVGGTFGSCDSVMTNISGHSYVFWQGGLGEYKDGVNIFIMPQGSGNLPNGGGYTSRPGNLTGNPGDPRYIHYWDENTNESGCIWFDTSNGWMWGSHEGGAVRFDKNGVIWCNGDAYFNAPEGSNVYMGDTIPPDLCSGSTNPNEIYSAVKDDVATNAGGAGGSFELLENR